MGEALAKHVAKRVAGPLCEHVVEHLASALAEFVVALSHLRLARGMKLRCQVSQVRAGACPGRRVREHCTNQ